MKKYRFGVQPKRDSSRKEEKYPDRAIITMGINQGKGTARKFYISKKASELLNFSGTGDEVVAFAIDEHNNIHLANLTDATSEEVKREATTFRVTKTFTFSDVKSYKHLKITLKLNDSVENYFELGEVDFYEGIRVAPLTLVREEPVEAVVKDSSSPDFERELMEESRMEGSDYIDSFDN